MPDRLQRNARIRRKVLVVDDELVNRRLLGFIVSRDYDVIYAENGVQALAEIRKNLYTLSLILLDLLMPEMDGFTLLEELDKDEMLRRIPVIVLTSEKSAEVQALQLGAVDFIPKPYDMPEVILARVNRSIELAEDTVLIHENERDPVTDLYSKGFFMQYVRQYDRYYPDAQMDAVTVNINRFHLVNEIHGRAYGDSVLKAVGTVIQEVLSRSGGLACRCEADQFCIYLPHREDYDTLLDEMSTRFAALTNRARITVRVGIYQNADLSIDVEQRFDRANMVFGKNKHGYKTVLGIYDTQTHEKELYNERLILDMDSSLSEKHFRVFYQPKYAIQGDRPVLVSAEALIRWIHPEQGMISPGTFIPLFEENGLVQKLDRYVWREAAAQIAAWREKYGRSVPVSVNVSRTDIYDSNLEEILTGLISENGLDPHELLLEITESAYTDNSSQIIETVNHLRSLGFRVEMDDFGSGYSSLNMLTSLPIDALKLDMRFMRNIAENEKDLRVVKLMIDIARYLEVSVIAEGVETQAQYELLKGSGCDIIQGYYFSKPVPPEEFERLIEKEETGC